MSQNDLCDSVITMYALFLLLETCKFPRNDFNFSVGRLNLGRWTEKEHPCRKLTRILESGWVEGNFRWGTLIYRKKILFQNFKFLLYKTRKDGGP